MKNSKFLYFLRLLPKAELNAFQDYVDSPLFNRRDSLKRLLKALSQYWSPSQSSPSKEELYSSVYPNKPFNDASLRTGVAQLFALFREFLAFRKYQDDTIASRMYLLEKLNELEVDKFLFPYYEKTRKLLQEVDMNSADRQYQMMLLEESWLKYQNRQSSRTPSDYSDIPGNHLLISMVIRLLHYELQLVTLTGNFKTDPNSSSLRQDIIELVSRQLTDLPPTVKAYSYLLTALKNPNETSPFYQVREILSSSWKDFSPVELKDVYISALNYANRKSNSGKAEFLKESFELYEEMINRRLITDNGKLSPFHLKNILNVALRLHKYDWAERFLETWRDSIFPDHAENAYFFNQGMIQFYRKEFHKAESCFNHVLQDYTDIFYGLNANSYLLQIYYETNEIPSLESLAHSFRVRLGRSKEISEYKREQYLSFIRYLMRLVNTPPKDKTRLQKLKEDILENQKKGLGTKWLLAKISQVSGN